MDKITRKKLEKKHGQIKICFTCGKPKALFDFYKSSYWVSNKGNPVVKYAVHRNCKICERKQTTSKRTSPAKTRQPRPIMSFEDTQIAKRNNLLKRKYGITLDRYNEFLERQNGGCAICGEPPTTQILVVDHCHKSGKIRGLLCHKHNSAIGFLNDSPELIKKANEYLGEAK